jgi:hypothetical protein
MYDSQLWKRPWRILTASTCGPDVNRDVPRLLIHCAKTSVQEKGVCKGAMSRIRGENTRVHRRTGPSGWVEILPTSTKDRGER